ncbi:hypothetical protein [Paraconexibacter sp.]|uniref:hypothetical protein n=1 Tax=Paraconexibacter sp. TaxID=2949640 RepID=UPI003562B2F7
MRNPLAVLITALLLLGVPAPVALAQSNPFTPPQPLVPPEQVAPEPANLADPDSEGLEGWQEALIFAAGFVLLFGIGLAVVMDARRRRPVTEEELHPGRVAAGDPEHRRAEHRKRKSKQRTQRQARKKNRPKRK